jgi:hypothetical protein
VVGLRICLVELRVRDLRAEDRQVSRFIRNTIAIREPRRPESRDSKLRRWWGDPYELCPDELLAELNGAKDYAKVTALQRRYRSQKS